MAFGITAAGLNLKRLTDIKSELETELRSILGNGINLLPTELLGQYVGIKSERFALLWEDLQAVYNSRYPDTANGVNLDNVVAITGIKRLSATKGNGLIATDNAGVAYGTLGTEIPAGSIISVDGNPEARFVTINLAVIGAGTDEIQDIDFSDVPDAGEWTLIFDGDETGTLAFNDNAAAVQAALNALGSLSAVSVTGNYADGFTVTFAGADGSVDQPLLQIGTNTLESGVDNVTVSFVETTKGILPNVLVELEAETAGLIPAYANTLTVIETPVAGWDSFNNPEDLTAGKDIETDAELRIRRKITLATAGAGTVEAIRSALLAIDEVEACVVYENLLDVIDAFGRPPHSVEAVILGGDDDEIAEILWATAPAGIERFGGVDVIIVDSQGFNQTISFSRPTEVDIWLEVDITVNTDFPVGGEATLKQQIVDYAVMNFSIGDPVVPFGTISIASAIGEEGGVAGIIDYEIRVGTAINPTLDDNITIDPDEVSAWDTSRVEVTIIP